MNGSRSATLVRRWVDLYTRGLPPEVRDARRDEIEADLWSQARDAETFSPAADGPGSEVLGRLILGMGSDIAWRLEQRDHVRDNGTRFRSLPMGTRVAAALAIAGGSALTAAMLVYSTLIAATPDGRPWSLSGSPYSLLLTVLGLGGTALISIATLAVILHFNERVGGGSALAGSLGGGAGLLAAVGAYPAILLLPVASGVVAWDLQRFGALPRSLAIAHGIAAVVFYVPLVANLMNSGIGATFVLGAAYPLTWIGIGVALLRGRQVNDHPLSVGEGH